MKGIWHTPCSMACGSCAGKDRIIMKTQKTKSRWTLFDLEDVLWLLAFAITIVAGAAIH